MVIFALSVLKLDTQSKDAAVPGLSREDAYKKTIVIPKIDEQQQIVSYIETKTAAIDLAISRTEREVALIQEFRTRLISDVVTGKIDVRDIEIPDIPEADEIIDELPEEPEEGEGMEEDNDFPRK
ncbi:MAG: hypothetical protein HC887_03635 [Desulfobacteraceae bacterium]|nr:hypothetical protein [Desulfobacteraceae bacterium]